jgi:hypothetical protein
MSLCIEDGITELKAQPIPIGRTYEERHGTTFSGYLTTMLKRFLNEHTKQVSALRPELC